MVTLDARCAVLTDVRSDKKPAAITVNIYSIEARCKLALRAAVFFATAELPTCARDGA
jgi:hypothetical protein